MAASNADCTAVSGMALHRQFFRLLVHIQRPEPTLTQTPPTLQPVLQCDVDPGLPAGACGPELFEDFA
jgi:hypothetical protein